MIIDQSPSRLGQQMLPGSKDELATHPWGEVLPDPGKFPRRRTRVPGIGADEPIRGSTVGLHEPQEFQEPGCRGEVRPPTRTHPVDASERPLDDLIPRHVAMLRHGPEEVHPRLPDLGELGVRDPEEISDSRVEVDQHSVEVEEDLHRRLALGMLIAEA